MSKTVVLKCKSQSKFQDDTYGTERKLHNVSADGKKAFCTVCESSAKYAKIENKKKKPTEAPSAVRPYKSI
jgi:hypothetical protein